MIQLNFKFYFAVFTLTKQCYDCNQVKPTTEFSKMVGGLDGLQANCKACASNRYSKWCKANPEKAKDHQSEWYKDNPEKVKEYAPDLGNRPGINVPVGDRIEQRVIGAFTLFPFRGLV